jgi:DNA-binding LacI/PurR family transcriptional regulator
MEPMTDTARRARMSDVAALAGVGTKTVSRVMNGEPNVSAKTAAKVLAAVAELDYEVDLFAGNLRRLGRRTNSIALLIGAVDNTFSGGIARAVEGAALKRHSVLLTSSLHIDPSRELEVVGELLRRRVDGLLLTTATHSLEAVATAHERGTAIVFVDGPPLGVTADAVLSDNLSGAALATRHLLEGGHRRVAYIGARHDVYTVAERRRGYEEELARWNVPLDPALVIEDVERDTARAAVRELLARRDRPDAIFSSQNETTVGVIGGMRDAGVHHDLALVGFDDFPTADLLDPGITVIAQDPERIGSIAAELLFRRIAGEDSPAETIFVPVRLIQRGSGEIAPRP